MISIPTCQARVSPFDRKTPQESPRLHPSPLNDDTPRDVARRHGAADLKTLLSELEPIQEPGVWVFAELPREAPLPPGTVAAVMEHEALTVVLPEADAEKSGLRSLFRAAWLTLRVHSALEAVGLVAHVSRVLAQAGIACNIIAGSRHDHLLVPYDRASDALDVLQDLQQRTGQSGADQSPEQSRQVFATSPT